MLLYKKSLLMTFGTTLVHTDGSEELTALYLEVSEVDGSSETSVCVCQNTRCHVPKDVL